MGWTVLFRRFWSQDVSFGDNVTALRITGLLLAQSAPNGVYPSGAFGVALWTMLSKEE
jgi:hypothetical protein